jgi:hypothetical protein
LTLTLTSLNLFEEDTAAAAAAAAAPADAAADAPAAAAVDAPAAADADISFGDLGLSEVDEEELESLIREVGEEKEEKDKPKGNKRGQESSPNDSVNHTTKQG